MIRSNSSSGKSSAGERKAIPALLIRMSTRPSSSTTRAASASTACLSVTSQRIATAWPPCSSIVATVRAAPSSFTSTIASAAPACASPFAIAAPRPLPPPVTAATRSSRRNRVSAYPSGTSKTGSQSSSVEAIVRLREPPSALGGDDSVVLPAEAAEALLVDARLGDDHHPRLERVLAGGDELRPRLVVAEACALPGVVRELLEAGRGDGRAGGGVDLASGRARLGSGEGGVRPRQDCGQRLALPVGRRAR